MEPKRVYDDDLSAEIWARLAPDPKGELPMVRQLYLALYQAIVDLSIGQGRRLPASRAVAKRLGIARNTVIAVYQQLSDEGLLASEGRRGTIVIHCAHPARSTQVKAWRLSKRSGDLSSRINDDRVFRPGEPDTASFPIEAWRHALARATRQPACHLAYQSQSNRDLQRAIARYLASYRSLVVSPDQILVTASTRQSLLVAAALFTDVGDTVWVESPGYVGAVDAFKQQGLNLVACEVDALGLVPPDTAETPRLIYATPCFQYPLGVPLGAERRQQLINLSIEKGTVLFEDDYDSEFRDDTQPRPALASTNSNARVLHAGTFSKLMFPAVRVAWLVLPETNMETGYRCLKALGGGDNTLAQIAVAELLTNGTIAKHLKHARQRYAHRRDVLTAALAHTRTLATHASTGSLCLVVDLATPVPMQGLIEALAAAEIGATPLELLRWDRKTKPRTCPATGAWTRQC